MRRIHRSDHTQQAIVDALRRVGVGVWCIGRPVDLLCCHKGVWHVVEVKNGANGLTKDQVEFIAQSSAPVHIVRTPEEAVRAVLGDVCE